VLAVDGTLASGVQCLLTDGPEFVDASLRAHGDP
jgi:hypothetical protein